jgi:hypothetical protein
MLADPILLHLSRLLHLELTEESCVILSLPPYHGPTLSFILCLSIPILRAIAVHPYVPSFF